MHHNSLPTKIYFFRKYLISAIFVFVLNVGLNAQQPESSLGTLKQINAGVLNVGYLRFQ
ncbi:hypothetical protein [Chryseobacterium daeguense]|uniref:hypothetical protein n=1 Tax=Chryseobacterium daeguense TaxID=412438 RepID=UPI0003FB42FB|nr:hypothetical protein [Chryseobacterium daeguense]